MLAKVATFHAHIVVLWFVVRSALVGAEEVFGVEADGRHESLQTSRQFLLHFLHQFPLSLQHTAVLRGRTGKHDPKLKLYYSLKSFHSNF